MPPVEVTYDEFTENVEENRYENTPTQIYFKINKKIDFLRQQLQHY